MSTLIFPSEIALKQSQSVSVVPVDLDYKKRML